MDFFDLVNTYIPSKVLLTLNLFGMVYMIALLQNIKNSARWLVKEHMPIEIDGVLVTPWKNNARLDQVLLRLDRTMEESNRTAQATKAIIKTLQTDIKERSHDDQEAMKAMRETLQDTKEVLIDLSAVMKNKR